MSLIPTGHPLHARCWRTAPALVRGLGGRPGPVLYVVVVPRRRVVDVNLPCASPQWTPSERAHRAQIFVSWPRPGWIAAGCGTASPR